MVSSGANHTHIDAVPLIPAGVAIYNVDSISSVEIVDGTLPIYFPDLYTPSAANTRARDVEHATLR